MPGRVGIYHWKLLKFPIIISMFGLGCLALGFGEKGKERKTELE